MITHMEQGQPASAGGTGQGPAGGLARQTGGWCGRRRLPLNLKCVADCRRSHAASYLPRQLADAGSRQQAAVPAGSRGRPTTPAWQPAPRLLSSGRRARAPGTRAAQHQLHQMASRRVDAVTSSRAAATAKVPCRYQAHGRVLLHPCIMPSLELRAAFMALSVALASVTLNRPRTALETWAPKCSSI